MRKNKFQYFKLIVVLILTIIFTASCDNRNKFENNLLLGTWEGVDSGYRLEVTTENDFLRNGDHYNYWVTKDSITVQYSGVLYIYVKPTTHSYRLKNNILTIDFRPGCYGFDSKEIVFSKK